MRRLLASRHFVAAMLAMATGTVLFYSRPFPEDQIFLRVIAARAPYAFASSPSVSCGAKRRVIRASGAGNLEFDAVLMHVAADAQVVLNEQIRHSILQVTHA